MKKVVLIWIGLVLSMGSLLAQEETGKKRKYVNHTEFGLLLGRVTYGGENNSSQSTENKYSITVQTFQGIQLGRQLATGVSLGADWYKSTLVNPISLGVRYDLTKDKGGRLYVSGDVGYGFTWFQDDLDGYQSRGGLMVNPGLGLKYGKPNQPAFTIGVGWKRQAIQVKKPPLWQIEEREEERIYNRLSLRLGMMF